MASGADAQFASGAAEYLQEKNFKSLAEYLSAEVCVGFALPPACAAERRRTAHVHCTRRLQFHLFPPLLPAPLHSTTTTAACLCRSCSSAPKTRWCSCVMCWITRSSR